MKDTSWSFWGHTSDAKYLKMDASNTTNFHFWRLHLSNLVRWIQVISSMYSGTRPMPSRILNATWGTCCFRRPHSRLNYLNFRTLDLHTELHKKLNLRKSFLQLLLQLLLCNFHIFSNFWLKIYFDILNRLKKIYNIYFRLQLFRVVNTQQSIHYQHQVGIF